MVLHMPPTSLAVFCWPNLGLCDQVLRSVLQQLLLRVLDKNKRVQEAVFFLQGDGHNGAFGWLGVVNQFESMFFSFYKQIAKDISIAINGV